jgi:hypothetical protein
MLPGAQEPRIFTPPPPPPSDRERIAALEAQVKSLTVRLEAAEKEIARSVKEVTFG